MHGRLRLRILGGTKKMNGLHLIGDLTGCRCDPQRLLDGEGFRAKCVAMVAESGLTTMDATFHTFDGGGFTGTVVLAESHLAIHTWPERQGLTLDVYVCNYSADNSGRAPKKVLIIGGGDGGSSEEALKHPSVEQVTMVEIDGDVIEVAKEHFKAVHNGCFDNPKLRVLVDDGMKFVRETQEKFDLIALDLNDPMGPAEALYSAEFFQQLRAALAVGGALTLHIGSPVARPERVAELAQRLNGIFRIVRPYTMYIPLYGSLWAMAGCSDKPHPKALTADEVDRRIDARKLQDLRYYNGETHEGVFALPNFVRDLVTPTRLKQPARGRRLGVVRAAAK